MQLALPFFALLSAVAAAPAPAWKFTERGSSGVVAIEAIVVAPNLVIFLDRASNDPLKTPDGKTAWSAIWNLETHTSTPLIGTTSDTFCGSGSLISNGSMISVGGTIPNVNWTATTGANDGRMSVRIFEPCTTADGAGCTIFDDPGVIHLAETRWYTSTARIFDGSLMIEFMKAPHSTTYIFFHSSLVFSDNLQTDPVNSFEFFPPKDGGVPRPSAFLERSNPVNLFPRVFPLPDGKVFILANNISMIYDIEKNTETMLPDLPNGQRVSNPFDGTATMLPLSPPLYIPEILACGGSHKSDTTPVEELSANDPASTQCSRLTLNPAGIARGWQVEHMPQGRMMPEMLLLPNGEVLILGGGSTGYAAAASIGVTFGTSNAANPVFTPMLYNPNALPGFRMSSQGFPATNIARMYHSSYTLTPQGNILLAGSNPNNNITIVPPGQPGFSAELRVETLDPPFFSAPRPVLSNVPAKIGFNQHITVGIDIPAHLPALNMKVALMDLGFSTHAFHNNQRLVFMDFVLSPNRRSLTILTPPNNRVYPPGPAYIFVTVGDSTSVAAHVMVGTGGSPPVADQGIRI
ncbi:hypothetical protein MKEN_00425200 [Mycena kentingensis (nom. inval.)]|nr:hypothetical protein MKEN_00425200 [Mycena kentingensis (nom. inval.)]